MTITRPDPILSHPEYLAARAAYQASVARLDAGFLRDSAHGREASIRAHDEAADALTTTYRRLSATTTTGDPR